MFSYRSRQSWKLGLVPLAISALIVSEDCTLAQIVPDGTLGAESSQVTFKSSGAFQIDGGATRETNLFHSFAQFSVPSKGIAYFNNAPSIKNIISRVTGSSISNIDGLLQANGSANFFLINPNGIVFGPNASLKLGGSFLATTASSLNFADGTQYSTTAAQTTPILTLNVPIGIQFGRNPGRIINQSQASPDQATNSIGSPVGLQVHSGQTLALVGDGVVLEGGNLTAAEGRIEIGSVAGNSLVNLNLTAKGLSLSYKGVQNFQDIQLTQQTFNGTSTPSYIDVSGEGSGNVQVQGRQVRLTDGSAILVSTLGLGPEGYLTVTASESVELIGSSTYLSTQAGNLEIKGSGNAGNLTITTGKLLIQNGAQVQTATLDKGSGGQLTVNASDSVELSGTDENNAPSSLISSTSNAGPAGNITISTRRLFIQNGAQITASSTGERISRQFIPATGQGGALTVNASDSVKLSGTDANNIPSSLSTRTRGSGNAGDLKITTGQLIVQDEATVDVSSAGTGKAGNLEVRAPSILLDNQGGLGAESMAGELGDITINTQNLRLRRNSNITTNASNNANGGNINIDTGTLVVLESSGITAKAVRGQGGNIQIKAQGLFLSPSDSITASSQLGINGRVQINTLVNNPSQGLVTLPIKPVNITGQIAQGCPAGVGPRASKFVVTGRGGLPPDPTEAIRSEPTLADLGTTVQSQENRTSTTSNNPTSSEPAPLVEAQGWVTNAKGEVELVAQLPTVTLDVPWLAPTICHTTKTAS